MKLTIFVVLSLLAVPCFAGNNQAAEAFATGFANALNRSMGGREYQGSNQQQVNVDVEPVHTRLAVIAIRDDGSEGAEFSNYPSCRQFVHNTYGFADCTIVAR